MKEHSLRFSEVWQDSTKLLFYLDQAKISLGANVRLEMIWECKEVPKDTPRFFEVNDLRGVAKLVRGLK